MIVNCIHVFKKQTNERPIDLPIQIKPVVSSLLPDEHSQMKEPRLFLQPLLTQGLLSHSFISIIQKEKTLLGLPCVSGKYYDV